MKKLFLILSSVMVVASMLSYSVDMPIMSWGGLGFIGGFFLSLELGVTNHE